jgi:serine/threonine protein kinase
MLVEHSNYASRERMPPIEQTLRSASNLHLTDVAGRRDSDTSLFSTAPEITGLAEGDDVQGMQMDAVNIQSELPQGTSELNMAREESSSNLFMVDPAACGGELNEALSEFEDKYSLVGHGPLGEGTFGLVWRCIPKLINATAEDEPKERAAKIVRKARLKERDMRYLLGEDGEVRTHLTMKHPHIVTLFEYFDEAHSVTLVLEYCRGGDLFDAIVRTSKATGRGFTERAAAIVITHVLSALEYIHSHRVVHRDIKCENILLAYVDVPVERNVHKLCDFGFASHDRGEGLSDRLGSPDTVAPEVVLGKRYSTPADLWSTGVLLYMMLSATPPFYATSDGEVLQKVQQGLYKFEGKIWDSISAPPKAMITSLMTVDALMRPTASEALKAEWLRDARPVDA